MQEHKRRRFIARSLSNNLAWLLVMFFVVITISVGIALSQNSPVLQITAPNDGGTATVGQTLTVSVQPTAGVSFPNGIAVVGTGPLGGAGPITNPPYTFSLTIPTNAVPGAYGLTAVGVDSTGTLRNSPSIIVQVEPASAPVQISVQPTSVILPALGSSDSLQVIATFADGSTADVTQSANMSYTSADPTIATANSPGSISAVGSGTTSIDVKYAPGGGNLEVIVPVTVSPPLIALAPSTLSFGSIPVGNSSTTQTVTVTNLANHPVTFFSVTASGDFIETDNCVSGSPISPSNSCSVNVTFSPALSGTRTGSVSLTNNAQGVVTNIALSGTGVPGASPTPSPTATPSATPTPTATPTPNFAGTPGKANCHGQSVAALSKRYGDLSAAAAALGYSSVQALQNAIKAFCGN